jgi:hypothetical protein
MIVNLFLRFQSKFGIAEIVCTSQGGGQNKMSETYQA